MKIYNKKLYKSNDDKIFFGVLGGIGEFLSVDPVILRVIYILVTIFTGIFPGTVAYFAIAIIMLKKGEMAQESSTIKEEVSESEKTETRKEETKPEEKNDDIRKEASTEAVNKDGTKES